MGQLSKNFGKIESITEIKNGVLFNSAAHFGSVQYYNENIVRVRMSSSPLVDSHSYALSAKPKDLKFFMEESRGILRLKSKNIRTNISLASGLILFADSSHYLLSVDALPVSWLGSEVTAYKKLMPGEKFIGLGEKTGPLNRRGHSYVHWNTDKFAYDVEQDPLYLSTPFYISLRNGDSPKDKCMYGIFLDNPHKSTFNFGASTDRFSWFSVESGELNYYFIHATSIAEIIKQYSWLTGRMKLPPKWALGFQQCRYSYYPDSEVYQLAQTFRDKKIPCDVLYLDIHYMEGYKAFTFDKERFPNPKELISKIKEKGFKTAVILDPGIKVEEGYSQYDSGIEQDVFVKYPDGERYVGEVWPGKSHFPDFTAQKVRDWWAEQLSFYTELGVKGFWNDMNEPAAWGQCLPNFLEFNFEGEWASHREARNIYGMQMTRSTAEGVVRQMPEERPFVLTRAGFSGIQRYSAVWTGDNVSSDEHLMLGVRLVNSLGLTGISFCGNDTGGFAGEASPELYARWISIGAFQPFFRAHSAVNSRDAEPWSFGEEVEQIARNYISLRYQLMPYIYSLIWESTRNGMPMNRSLTFYHPYDDRTYLPEYQHQFMLGASIMIAPTESSKGYLKVWLPEGDWFNFWTGEKLEGDREIIVECPIWNLPIFVRSGAIIPMQPVVQHLDMPQKQLILHIYNGKTGNTDFYEDDGHSYAYEEQNYNLRKISLDSNSLVIAAVSGTYRSSIEELKVIFHGIAPEAVKINEQLVSSLKETIRHVQPIEGIDTFYADKGVEMKEDNLSTICTKYSSTEIKITW